MVDGLSPSIGRTTSPRRGSGNPKKPGSKLQFQTTKLARALNPSFHPGDTVLNFGFA
jgi:hypothetical protein